MAIYLYTHSRKYNHNNKDHKRVYLSCLFHDLYERLLFYARGICLWWWLWWLLSCFELSLCSFYSSRAYSFSNFVSWLLLLILCVCFLRLLPLFVYNLLSLSSFDSKVNKETLFSSLSLAPILWTFVDFVHLVFFLMSWRLLDSTWVLLRLKVVFSVTSKSEANIKRAVDKKQNMKLNNTLKFSLENVEVCYIVFSDISYWLLSFLHVS